MGVTPTKYHHNGVFRLGPSPSTGFSSTVQRALEMYGSWGDIAPPIRCTEAAMALSVSFSYSTLIHSLLHPGALSRSPFWWWVVLTHQPIFVEVFLCSYILYAFPRP